MSAPCATICLAWSRAAAGSRKRPPSEKESGVTLSTPITIGRPSASKRASQSGGLACARAEPAAERTSVMAVALRRAHQRCQAPSRFVGLSICDFLRKSLGVLDPAGHELFGGKKANQLTPLVGLGHGFGEPRGVAIAQLLDGVDADLAQQPGVFPAHALDAQLVGYVSPTQKPLLIELGLGREKLASLRVFRRLQQPLRGSYAKRSERPSLIRVDIFDGADRVGHRVLLAPGQRRHQRSDELAKTEDRAHDLADCGISPPAFSAAVRSAPI